jgi:cell division protein FtsN
MAIKKSMRKQATPMRRHPSIGSGWLTGLLMGLAIGGFVVFYLLAIQPKHLSSTTPEPTAEIKNTDGNKKKTNSPRFDFYKLLPENAPNKRASTQTTPLPTISPSAPPSAFDTDTTSITGVPIETRAATPNSPMPGSYLLQAGAFRTETDADRIRATIILLGLPARVEPIKNNKGELFYRVYVGSFTTAEAMKNAQTTLGKNNINAVVIKSP